MCNVGLILSVLSIVGVKNVYSMDSNIPHNRAIVNGVDAACRAASICLELSLLSESALVRALTLTLVRALTLTLVSE